MKNVRFTFLLTLMALASLTLTQCSKDAIDPNASSSKKEQVSVEATNPDKLFIPQYDAPTLQLKTKGMAGMTIRVCAAATGAPAGFTLQWMKKSDFVSNGNQWADHLHSYCSATFLGILNSRYQLSPNECVDIRVGELLFDIGTISNCNKLLECGNEYVFRVVAHASIFNGLGLFSDWSPVYKFSTWNCEIKPNMVCTKTADEWRANPLTWPATATPMTIGTKSYTKNQLLNILFTPPLNNGLVALAHQVIATKLNVAAGSPNSYVWHPLWVVDGMIGNKLIPPVGGASMGYTPEVWDRMNYLANYNEGAIGPGHCFGQ